MTEESMLPDETLMQQLNAHPLLKRRIVSLLAVVQDSSGDLKLADEAEQRVIEEIRQMGQEALQSWANSQVHATEQSQRQRNHSHREGKKNSSGTAPSGTSG